MSKSIMLTVAAILAAALAACAPSTQTANNIMISKDMRRDARPDTSDIAALIAETASQSHQERLARRAQVAAAAATWREFTEIADSRRQRREHPELYAEVVRDDRGLMVGLAKATVALETCVVADPTWVEAWADLGHLRLEIGDRDRARACLERAFLAAEATSPADDATMLRIHQDLAWTLRELALWDEGLAAVAKGLEDYPTNRDLWLVKGLLLAGAGRANEATQLGRRLPRREVRYFDTRTDSWNTKESNYERRWIKSQTHLAEGDVREAYRALDEVPDDQRVDIHDQRGQGWKLGYNAISDNQRRFWGDLGLLAELLGDPSAVDFYVAAYRQRDYAFYYPAMPGARGPLVMDVPDSRMPFMTSFAHGHYLLGSPWGYVALQVDLMSLALFDEQRDRAAREALEMLDVLDRRKLRPAVGQALRGRVFYRQEEYADAYRHLTAARDSFAAAGDVDARTSLLLGLIDLGAQKFSLAVARFEESARADGTSPLTWRMLGVAYANLERTDDALAVMNRAVAMEPRSVAGYYNRGLLNLQMRRCAAALVDLDRAWRLGPENEDVQHLLQVAASCVRAEEEGGEGPRVRAGGVEVSSFTPGTDMLLDHLAADLEDFFIAGSDTTTPTSGRRITQAVACMDRGDHIAACDLLAPHWGDDLTPLEEVILLEAERRLGRQERLSALVDDTLAGSVTTSNPYVWALMVLEVRGAPERYGPDAEDRVLARLLDHSAEFSGRTVRDWAQALRGEVEGARGSEG